MEVHCNWAIRCNWSHHHWYEY